MAQDRVLPASRTLPDQLAADVAIVGGGPAGLAAAVTAARLGLRVAVLDEQPAPGGQYLTSPRLAAPSQHNGTAAEREGRKLLAELPALPVDLWSGTLAWNLDRELVLNLYRGGRAATLRAGAVILACGGREQSVPFPGWTLPGVTTVGAAQLLAKRHDLLPGKRILVAGSGPLLLAAASEMIRLGAEVVAVLEATDPRHWLGHAPAVWSQWDRLAEGVGHLRRLRQARAPYRFRRAVVAAHGENRVASVDIAALDQAGAPLRRSLERVPVDALCVSFGLTPNIELAQLAGAAISFDAASGGWAPQVDEHLRRTVPGLIVAGENVAVAGASSAFSTGRIAGLTAALHLGKLNEDAVEQELMTMAPQRRRQARFGRMLNRLFVPPPGLHSITTDETVLCRCEEVCAGEVRAAVAAGAQTLDALKTWTRVGQGPCQGRTCGPILAQLIERECGRRAADAGLFAVRPPVKPLPLTALAQAVGSTGAPAS